ncbi:MAG: RNA polymerase sigma factor [Acidobacteriota bacterium]|nr:RNA polymerase sigma factor [Acidobacteriota bacterium]
MTNNPSSPSPHRDRPSKSEGENWRRIFGELAEGREAALGDLYDAAATQIYGLALWRTGSEDDAADVVQDVFVKVAEQGPKLAKVRNPKGWLLTVTHRAAVDITRRRIRRSAEPLDEYPFLTATHGDSDTMLDAAHASVLLAGMPPNLRDVIYLKHFVDCTFAEIGAITGVPTFTAASRYRKGISDLRNLMKDEP